MWTSSSALRHCEAWSIPGQASVNKLRCAPGLAANASNIQVQFPGQVGEIQMSLSQIRILSGFSVDDFPVRTATELDESLRAGESITGA